MIIRNSSKYIQCQNKAGNSMKVIDAWTSYTLNSMGSCQRTPLVLFHPVLQHEPLL